ncbi:protein kinase [Spongiactinospora gelatinilytica]|uniref:non-specific serine/threonine protein kinase n=1 Tax=Spongiactinospora gelatinilytica TaxID=2666298 RepID=A0A2W2HA58_9ACTN|nr:serine/threonine-protein kinase [Spongiactinospora gelatinilytica]PZG43127.1 protein kinase [Spongiactinospora gelatinilytica]
MVIADRYVLDDLPLGQGGMGAVYGGHDRHLDRKVAVKFLRVPIEHDAELEQRFIREARILARLEHPGAPVLYDFGAHDQRLFQVMQFIDGVTVADVVSEHGPLPVQWAAAIAAQACAVLTAAHALSICHRDLKPNNLMLCPDGDVKVLDFGLAVLREAGAAPFTRIGQILGTPAYMAPEQIQRGVASPRSDLYALGCVLHETLTGRPVFAGPTDYAVLDAHVNQPPPRLGGVPPGLAALVTGLLAKRPEDRPEDAATVYGLLEPYAVDLPALPGFLTSPSVPCPGRMYARMVGRVLGGER